MSDAIELIWRRAELPNHVLSAAELALWQPNQRDAILKLGLLRRTSDATALICEDCGPPHPVEVIRNPRKPQRPYYLCEDIGRVPLTPEALQRWEADFDQIGVQIRRVVGLTAKAITLVPSRIWLLGRQRIEDRYWELFLMRGLCWPDGPDVLNQCSRLQQSPAPVVVVPYRLPAVKSSEKLWPIRTLSEIASLADSALVVDVASLMAAVGSSGISSPASGPKVPRTRMSRSLGTPEAVKAVNLYLQHTQMTDTQFGNQFQTTDKTVRKFLNSGKMRRSNFEAMADSMGLTTESLLCGESPRAVKPSASR